MLSSRDDAIIDVVKLENNQEKHDPIADLRVWRFSYSDEIPKEIIRGSGHAIEYKVKKTSWMIPVGCLSLLVYSGRLDGELKEEAERFIEKFSSESFNQRLVTAEDIAEANSLIDRVLQSIK